MQKLKALAAASPNHTVARTADNDLTYQNIMDEQRSQIADLQRVIMAQKSDNIRSALAADDAVRDTRNLMDGIKQDLRAIRDGCGSCGCDDYPGPNCPRNPMKASLTAVVNIAVKALTTEAPDANPEADAQAQQLKYQTQAARAGGVYHPPSVGKPGSKVSRHGLYKTW